MTTTLITGANKGLGKETARLLVEAGHTVWVGSRDKDRGTAAAAELGARFVQLDVTDDASVAAALATIAASGTGLDVVVNNAGIARRANGASMTEALDGPSVLDVFNTNAVGIVRVTQAALPLLQQSPNPVVVNISSALGSFWATHEPTRPASHFVSIAYGSSKAAVSMLTVPVRQRASRNQVQRRRTRHHRHRVGRRRPRQPPRPARHRKRSHRRQTRQHRTRRPDRAPSRKTSASSAGSRYSTPDGSRRATPTTGPSRHTLRGLSGFGRIVLRATQQPCDNPPQRNPVDGQRATPTALRTVATLRGRRQRSHVPERLPAERVRIGESSPPGAIG